MRPKAKFLTVVWGEAYIVRFASLALPSFLAPGNLPALAQSTELEVVIMTRRDDIENFEKHATFRRLRAVCPVRFVEIDDLITSAVYGVTLTLAYARPVIACGPGMLDTHFVFMNADFVLADGSLRSLAKHILAGRSIVLAPSFRATAEALEPGLLKAVNIATATLAIPPREMAGLTLRHPHPTTVAKTVNQGFCHSIHPNQFYWQVDEHTFLARYYLIFMLCLKPERIVKQINSYCDYGFIPEMCPSGDTAVMADSDEFFMLELQRREQELFLLRLGSASPRAISRSLNEWTTIGHRGAAQYDLVFHADDIPASIERTKTEARAFVARLESLLGTPVPHAFHPYWVSGVEAWRYYRRMEGLPAAPPELDTGRRRGWVAHPRMLIRRASEWLKLRLRTGHRMVMGQVPWVTPFHPDWLDYRLLRNALSSLPRSPEARVLVVRSEAVLPDQWMALGGAARFATPDEVLRDGLTESDQDTRSFTHVLVYLKRKECRLTRQLFAKCRPIMAPRSECQIFIHHLRGETEPGDFSSEVLQYMEEIVAWPPNAATFDYMGGNLKRLNTQLCNMLGGHYVRFGLLSLPWLIPGLVIMLPTVALSNLALWRNHRASAFVRYCSSMLIRVVV